MKFFGLYFVKETLCSTQYSRNDYFEKGRKLVNINITHNAVGYMEKASSYVLPPMQAVISL